MVKVLVFDFSGVLYSSRFEKFMKSVLRLVPGLSGNKVIEAFYNKHQDYYAGLIDKNNLWSGAFYLLDIPRTKFTKINKIIFEKGLFTENKYMPKLIKKLSKNYKIAVLSNSAKEMEMVFSTSNYHKYFTGFFWSHKANVRKPDERFYKFNALTIVLPLLTILKDWFAEQLSRPQRHFILLLCLSEAARGRDHVVDLNLLWLLFFVPEFDVLLCVL